MSITMLHTKRQNFYVFVATVRFQRNFLMSYDNVESNIPAHVLLN